MKRLVAWSLLAACVCASVGCPASSPPAVESPAVATNVKSASETTPVVAAAPPGNHSETPNAAPSTPPAVAKAATDKIEVITFDDLNINMQQDIVYRPWMLTDRVQELDGKRVRLNGYMHGGVSQQKGIKQFVLLKNTECKFGPGGQADHLVSVKMQGEATAAFSETPLQIEGILKLNPYQGPDGNTWSVYDLLGETVKPVRR